MKMGKWLALSMLGVLPCAQMACAQEAPQLKCEIGPATKTYGGTEWLVYSCDDKRSLVFVTAPHNPATPFYFMYHHTDKGYQLRGEGTGDKQVTDHAFAELKVLTEDQLASLLIETRKASAK